MTITQLRWSTLYWSNIF